MVVSGLLALRMSAEQLPLGKRDYYGLLGVTFEVRAHPATWLARCHGLPVAALPRRGAADAHMHSQSTEAQIRAAYLRLALVGSRADTTRRRRLPLTSLSFAEVAPR